MRRIPLTLLLAGVFLLALESPAPADLALALAVGCAAGIPLGRPAAAARPRTGLLRRALALGGLLVWTASEAMKGTASMVRVVLRGHACEQAGLVDVPLGDRSSSAVALVGLLASLTPGSLLLDVDEERGVMVFHLIDRTQADSFRADLDRVQARWIRPLTD